MGAPVVGNKIMPFSSDELMHVVISLSEVDWLPWLAPLGLFFLDVIASNFVPFLPHRP